MAKPRLVIAAAGLMAALLAACGTPASSGGGGGVPTTTALVTRTDITSRQQLPGTLTYAGSYAVINQAGPGIFTAMAAPGAVFARGQVLYHVNGRPIVLLYGDPFWRQLSVGIADGSDIGVLQANLAALGFATGLRFTVHYDWITAIAVRRWQASLGVAQTGIFGLADGVAMPGPIRVTTVHQTIGVPAQPGQPVMDATSTQHAVLLLLNVSQPSLIKVGAPVIIALPDGKTTAPGTVTTVGTVATAEPANQNGGSNNGPPSASVPVTIALTDPSAGGSLDQAPVTVGIVFDVHKGVLAVPVMALLAQPAGQYAVEVVDGSERRLVAVTTGLFDDRGLVEVSSPSLHEGMSVEVPRS
jgi:peptidoglycan hydrolase-like protein with peptidoglycan-binding domain